MKQTLFAIVCWVAFLPNSAAAQSLAHDVRQLGKGGEDMPRINRMAKQPRRATELLVAELHVVADEKVLPGEEAQKAETEHVLWSIRALRFVTGGKDFCAKSSTHFGKNESERNRLYFLSFSHGSCLTFFSLWPSQGVDYIAPADAQKAIIGQWRDWYRTEGATFRFRPLENPAPEQWSW